MLAIPLCVQATREHCSTRLLLQKDYLAHPHKVICLPAPVGFDTTKWLGFLCLTSTFLKPRVQLFFLTKGWCCPLVEDEKRVRVREGPVLDGLKKSVSSSNVIT